jgi:hypothetical protein
MNQRLGEAFKKIAEIEPESRIFGAIMIRIEKEKERMARKKLNVVYATLAGSHRDFPFRRC